VTFACSFATAGASGNVTFSYFDIVNPAAPLQTSTVTTMRKNKFFCRRPKKRKKHVFCQRPKNA
jgi:hypothetical protein